MRFFVNCAIGCDRMRFEVDCAKSHHRTIFTLKLRYVPLSNRVVKVLKLRKSGKNTLCTMGPLAATIRSMHDIGAQLTARWNQLYAVFC